MLSGTETKKRHKRARRREAVKAHHLPPTEREFNFEEVNFGYIKQDEIFVEADRCYMCRKPTCVEACPASFDIRGMLEHVREGEYKKAADLVHNFYCFSSSFNRICPAFCQEACVAAKKGDSIQILNIKRFLADNYAKPEDYYEIAPPTGMSVAIIGSGPAGLTAAHQLAKEGHDVTIFEKHDVLGGMLAVGIPEYRLPKQLLSDEIMDLQNFGIKFKTNVEFGKDQTYDDLMRSGYDAILIAHGAHAAKWIGLPGEDLPGSIHAVDFLRDVALGNQVHIGPKVIVVGGGDVAIDAVRVATRLGCDAQIVYRRSLQEMPATKEEIDETLNEDIPINYLTNPVRIIGQDKVEAVELIKMELGEPDDSGRRRPIPIEGSEYIVPVDTVIQAVSQEPGMDGIKEQGFKTTRWNTFEVMDNSQKTNIYGVFAAGDDVSGPKTAIEAIKQAKDAATEIHEFLLEKMGTPLPEEQYVNKFE